ncbi:hypothetical protein [Glaciimonas immobilis]|uniref:Type IV pilus biogenesis protein PilP n=1 Tax=Glaciimonas immobilis TaxID=728004 RepID=A0A840RWE7_9BURK|nr:hypothetical protein [Glaciimonas immobilis]KAF3998297.1 hypothetical protein HAV38_08810 [Glaciimonas immobilis]MBB5201913.1 hypothetical protein [Glaciimonas immobilis]
MKIPLYLRVLLPLTIVACGYAMLTEDAQEDPPHVDTRSPKVKPQRAIGSAKNDGLPELTALASRNLFPYQGPPIIAPVANADAGMGAGGAAVIQPPPEPVRAPPIPFTVSGVWVDGAQRKIILSKGEQTIILCQGCGKLESPQVGDVLVPNYRLDKIENERITFTYLPLQLAQSVDIDRAMSGTGN